LEDTRLKPIVETGEVVRGRAAGFENDRRRFLFCSTVIVVGIREIFT
jgi:hypothetical protein